MSIFSPINVVDRFVIAYLLLNYENTIDSRNQCFLEITRQLEFRQKMFRLCLLWMKSASFERVRVVKFRVYSYLEQTYTT